MIDINAIPLNNDLDGQDINRLARLFYLLYTQPELVTLLEMWLEAESPGTVGIGHRHQDIPTASTLNQTNRSDNDE